MSTPDPAEGKTGTEVSTGTGDYDERYYSEYSLPYDESEPHAASGHSPSSSRSKVVSTS